MKRIYLLSIFLGFCLSTLKPVSFDLNRPVSAFDYLIEKHEILEVTAFATNEINQHRNHAGLLKIGMQMNEELELLDSIVVRNQDGVYVSKNVYEYDNKGLRTLETSYNWVADPGVWVGNTKIEYVRGMNTDNDMTVLSSNYRWDIQINDWLPTSQIDYVLYGTSNVIKIQIQSVWNVSGKTWDKSSRFEQFYEDDGNYLTTAYYNWDVANGKWTGTSKTGITYSDDGLYVQYRASYSWNNDVADWTAKQIKKFDKFDNVISDASYLKENSSGWKGISKSDYDGKQTTTYTWNITTSDWIPATKIIADTDIQNREVYYESYVWNSTSQKWEGERYERTAYDDGNNITLKISHTWNPVNNNWVQTYYLSCVYQFAGDDTWSLRQKIETTISLSGRELSRIQMFRNSIYTDWIDSFTYKREHTYDENDRIMQTLTYFLDRSDMSWILSVKMEYTRNEHGNTTAINNYNKVDGNWVKTRESIYYYSTIILGNSAPAHTIEIKSFPNPVRDTMTITGTKAGQTIRILSIDGSVLGAYRGQNETTELNIASYAQGMYVVQIDNVSIKILKSEN